MTHGEAHRLFAVERRRFARAYPHCAGAQLAVLRRRCPPDIPDCLERNVAWCYPETGQVFILERALRLSRDNVVALFRHELGHLARPDLDERGADDVASRVGGRLIRYDAADVQTVGRGGVAPRPARLPR